MLDQKRLESYAKLAIVKGVNLQQGQTLLINASIDAVDMTRACVEEAYRQGAKEVVVFYNDDCITRLNYEYKDVETLCEIHPWQVDSKLDYLKEGACLLYIMSDYPGIMKGIDAEKIGKRQMASAQANKEVQVYSMANKTQWCIVAVPNQRWADLVFPEFEGEQGAVEELWDRILNAVHVGEDNDPIQEWTILNDNFKKRIARLNEYHFDQLHFENELGTDLYVKLVEDHLWAGGGEQTSKGVDFHPNMPTEEIFTMPHRLGVSGKVVASRPLVYNGTLIDGFWLTFQEGAVNAFDAEKGKEALNQLIHFDEGSCRLGEVALVPYDSPISRSNILFYNTLFDENASCHLALGDAYPSNLKDGLHMSEEELKEHGANHSLTHIDFMFGTPGMKVTGITKDGKAISVFESGNFVF